MRDDLETRAKKENINDVLGDISKVGNFINDITTPVKQPSSKQPGSAEKELADSGELPDWAAGAGEK